MTDFSRDVDDQRVATRVLIVYPPTGVGIGVRKIDGLSTTDCSSEVDARRVATGVL